MGESKELYFILGSTPSQAFRGIHMPTRTQVDFSIGSALNRRLKNISANV
jgi:hypothetical protein